MFKHPDIQVALPSLPLLIEWSQEKTLAGPIHGLSHWNRVAENGQQLCQMAEKDGQRPDRLVVFLFAYVHDSCREDDWSDIEHGPRAARAIAEIRETLLPFLTDEQFLLLRMACAAHTKEERTDILTLNICLDSDRLDLPRVGICPQPERMASKYGALWATGC